MCVIWNCGPFITNVWLPSCCIIFPKLCIHAYDSYKQHILLLLSYYFQFSGLHSTGHAVIAVLRPITENWLERPIITGPIPADSNEHWSRMLWRSPVSDLQGANTWVPTRWKNFQLGKPSTNRKWPEILRSSKGFLSKVHLVYWLLVPEMACVLVASGAISKSDYRTKNRLYSPVPDKVSNSYPQFNTI